MPPYKNSVKRRKLIPEKAPDTFTTIQHNDIYYYKCSTPHLYPCIRRWTFIKEYHKKTKKLVRKSYEELTDKDKLKIWLINDQLEKLSTFSYVDNNNGYICITCNTIFSFQKIMSHEKDCGKSIVKQNTLFELDNILYQIQAMKTDPNSSNMNHQDNQMCLEKSFENLTYLTKNYKYDKLKKQIETNKAHFITNGFKMVNGIIPIMECSCCQVKFPLPIYQTDIMQLDKRHKEEVKKKCSTINFTALQASLKSIIKKEKVYQYIKICDEEKLIRVVLQKIIACGCIHQYKQDFLDDYNVGTKIRILFQEQKNQENVVAMKKIRKVPSKSLSSAGPSTSKVNSEENNTTTSLVDKGKGGKLRKLPLGVHNIHILPQKKSNTNIIDDHDSYNEDSVKRTISAGPSTSKVNSKEKNTKIKIFTESESTSLVDKGKEGKRRKLLHNIHIVPQKKNDTNVIDNDSYNEDSVNKIIISDGNGDVAVMDNEKDISCSRSRRSSSSSSSSSSSCNSSVRNKGTLINKALGNVDDNESTALQSDKEPSKKTKNIKIVNKARGKAVQHEKEPYTKCITEPLNIDLFDFITLETNTTGNTYYQPNKTINKALENADLNTPQREEDVNDFTTASLGINVPNLMETINLPTTSINYQPNMQIEDTGRNVQNQNHQQLELWPTLISNEDPLQLLIEEADDHQQMLVSENTCSYLPENVNPELVSTNAISIPGAPLATTTYIHEPETVVLTNDPQIFLVSEDQQQLSSSCYEPLAPAPVPLDENPTERVNVNVNPVVANEQSVTRYAEIGNPSTSVPLLSEKEKQLIKKRKKQKKKQKEQKQLTMLARELVRSFRVNMSHIHSTIAEQLIPQTPLPPQDDDGNSSSSSSTS